LIEKAVAVTAETAVIESLVKLVNDRRIQQRNRQQF